MARLFLRIPEAFQQPGQAMGMSQESTEILQMLLDLMAPGAGATGMGLGAMPQLSQPSQPTEPSIRRDLPLRAANPLYGAVQGARENPLLASILLPLMTGRATKGGATGLSQIERNQLGYRLGAVKHEASKGIFEMNPELRERLARLPSAEQQKVEIIANRYLHNVELTAKLPQTAELFRLFKRGEPFKDWYKGAAEEIGALIGREDTELFIDLIAATSPNVRVRRNIDSATRIYIAHKEGRRVSSRLAANLMKTHMPNVYKALRREPLKGPKVSRFGPALKGDPNAVVIDTWMMKVFGFPPGKGANETQVQFLGEWVTSLARRRGVTPAQMQAALWVGSKMEKKLVGEKTEEAFRPFTESLHEVLGTVAAQMKKSNPRLYKSMQKHFDTSRFQKTLGIALALTSTGLIDQILSDVQGENP